MLKSRRLAAAVCGTLAFGTVSAAAAPPAVAAVQAVVPSAEQLAVTISEAILAAERQAVADGLARTDAAAAIVAAINEVIIISGVSPAVADAALRRVAEAPAGTFSSAAVNATSIVSLNVRTALRRPAAASLVAARSVPGRSLLGFVAPPPSGGGGGSDYRVPGT